MTNRRDFLSGLAGSASLAPRRVSGAPAAKPNILWVTAEDISPTLGCYGDTQATTPNLDRFAAQSVRFTNAFSVHPCCSPSRSCLATGIYPTRLGTFQHRGRVRIVSKEVRTFPALLREAGYYTFNGMLAKNSFKTDYNFVPLDDPWCATGSEAVEWNKRAAGQPFFGQVNLFVTHQSQYGLRPPGLPVPAGKRDPSAIRVPPYHPDTPAVREIWAEYRDQVTVMDGMFGDIMKRLEEDGLADNTIVFFFGDNGHGIPGGKVWLWDPGIHVPLMIRIPEKWRHLRSAIPEAVTRRLVSFVDFAPTVLSLAGVPPAPSMQGRAFLGPAAAPPRDAVYAARDMHDNADFDFSRTVRTERYQYIRNFMPHIGWDAIVYSWGRAPYMLEEWRRAAEKGSLDASSRQSSFFRRTKPVEELYDVERDPHQLRNLAADPRHREVLARMRKQCEGWMIGNHDLGLLSQYELYTRSERDDTYTMALDARRNPTAALLKAAKTAGEANASSIPALLGLMRHEDACVRRWGMIGLLGLGAKAAPAKTRIAAALDDSSPDVRIVAAQILCGLGETEAPVRTLIRELTHSSRLIRFDALWTLAKIGEAARPALPHLERALTPSAHLEAWSRDNLPMAIDVVRARLGAGVPPLDKTHQLFDIVLSRQKYV
jgi:N-sulfoglucosamine sulfohydrolase